MNILNKNVNIVPLIMTDINTNEEIYIESESKKSKIITILSILLALSLIAGIWLFYSYYKTNISKDGIVYTSKANEEKMKKIYDEEKSILNQQLDQLKSDYEKLISESSTNSAEKERLMAELDAKRIEIANKIKTAGPSNPKALTEANAKIARLEKEKLLYIFKTDSLFKNNADLIAKLKKAEDDFVFSEEKSRNIQTEKDELNEKIQNGSALKIADLKSVGIRKKGSTDIETFKANRVEKLKISFTLLSDELLQNGEKELSIRILGTSNEVLGSNNDNLADTDNLITMKQNVNYQGEPIKININYLQKAAYKKGQYTVEILSGTKLLSRAAFLLN